MNLRSRILTILAACSMAVGLLGTAFAQTTTTFAQFKQQIPNNKAFEYTSGGVFHVTPASLPVYFSYGVKNKYDDAVNGGVFGDNINAFLNLNATKTGSTAVQGSFLSQNLTVLTMAFVLDTASLTAPQLAALAAAGLAGKTNLLSVTGTAMLSGPAGSQVPSLSADTLTGFTINYTSDFLTFPTGIVSQDYNLSFSGATPPLGLNGAGQLRGFIASGTGTFDYSVVPEGNSLLYLSFGLLPMAAVVAYRGKRRSISSK
jgi:hypothetical protein